MEPPPFPLTLPNQQYIVLGAEDDVLHGGGGDDTIGSKGGDDQLFGDEGDDTVVGGIGNDTLHGGDGDDILQGGASDAGTWTFALNVEGEMVARFTPMDTDLADGVGITFTGDWSTSLVDSRVSIVGQDYGTLSDIALLYHAVTHQFADVDVLTAAAESGRSSGEWAQLAYDHFIANNTLFQLFGVTSDAVTMRALVNQVFGSSTNDQVTSGLTFINEGGSWADYLLQLARQSEHKAQLTDDEGLMQLANPMTLTETGWSADAGDNTLNGGAGNDLLVGGTGNNVLDGGEGIDLAAFVGTLSDYTLGLQQTSTSQVNLVIKNVHTGNTTTLLNVEGVKIGGDIYTGNANLATLVVGDDRPLDEFAQLVGLADLEAIGVPQSWL